MHVILGMVILAVIWAQARKGAYTSRDAHGLESGAAYWHMVDLLWIILFPLVYVMR
jgi:nitric oxide reductase NorE protein